MFNKAYLYTIILKKAVYWVVIIYLNICHFHWSVLSFLRLVFVYLLLKLLSLAYLLWSPEAWYIFITFLNELLSGSFQSGSLSSQLSVFFANQNVCSLTIFQFHSACFIAFHIQSMLENRMRQCPREEKFLHSRSPFLWQILFTSCESWKAALGI